jgi:hypothetical protein
MEITAIEDTLKSLINPVSKATFIYDLLLAYDQPKSSITRLQKGNLNLSKLEGEIIWKKKLYYKEVQNTNLHAVITDIKAQLKNSERFIIVTDYKSLLSIDTKINATLDILINDLPKHADFFLPWTGREKMDHIGDHPADVKADGLNNRTWHGERRI